MIIDKTTGKYLQSEIKSVRQHLTAKQRIVVSINSSSERERVIFRLLSFLRENIDDSTKKTTDFSKTIYFQLKTINTAAAAVTLIEDLLKHDFDSLPQEPLPERNGIQHPGTSGTDHYGHRDSKTTVAPEDIEDAAITSSNLYLYLLAVLVILILIIIFY